MLSGRQIAVMVCAFFKINDVQGSAFGMDDVLNVELRNETLKIVRPSLGRDFDGDGHAEALLEGMYERHLERSAVDSFVQPTKVSNKTGTSPQDGAINLRVTVTRKAVA